MTIKFRRAIMLPDMVGSNGDLCQPKVKMVEKYIPHRGLTAMVAEIDLGTECELTVPELGEPTLPIRSPGMSERYWNHLVDEAFDKLAVRRREAEILRHYVAHNVARGSIEVVADPSNFMGDHEALAPEVAAKVDAARAEAEAASVKKLKGLNK